MLVNEPPSDNPRFSKGKALTTTVAGPTNTISLARRGGRGGTADPPDSNGQLSVGGGPQFETR